MFLFAFWWHRHKIVLFIMSFFLFEKNPFTGDTESDMVDKTPSVKLIMLTRPF